MTLKIMMFRTLPRISSAINCACGGAARFSIMATYGLGGIGRQAKIVAAALERAAEAARLPTAEALADSQSDPYTDVADVDNALKAHEGSELIARDAANDAAVDQPAESITKGALTAIVRDLERRGAVHAATLRALESTTEWRDYDAHLTFELLMLRHRYQSTDTPLTSARRSQMQAHLRAKQRAIMEAHADRVAKTFVATLTPGERDEFRAKFMRLDAVGLELQPPSDDEGGRRVDDAAMRAALLDVAAAAKDPHVRPGLVAAAAEAGVAADAAAADDSDGRH